MGKLYIVATPIGNLDDITKRALDTLGMVDFILCEDTRHSLKLLNYFNIKKPLYSYHKFNEINKSKTILEEIKKGSNVALITDAGTPCISDPGCVITKEAILNKIEVVGVGGISAFVTALSISGFDTTNFSFLGFFPRENKDKTKLISLIKESKVNTFIFYESPKRIKKTLEYLKEELEEFEIALFNDLTKLHERHYYGSIEEVLKELSENENYENGEYTFIIRVKEYQKNEIKISNEALLIDVMLKNGVSLKEAVGICAKEYNLSKNDLYSSSVNIKNLFK